MPTFELADRLYTVPEVAAYLHIHRNTLHRWIREGRLDTVTFGNEKSPKYRITSSEIQRLVTEGAPMPEIPAAIGNV